MLLVPHTILIVTPSVPRCAAYSPCSFVYTRASTFRSEHPRRCALSDKHPLRGHLLSLIHDFMKHYHWSKASADGGCLQHRVSRAPLALYAFASPCPNRHVEYIGQFGQLIPSIYVQGLPAYQISTFYPVA